jgi:AraC-like DNA-binding protein
MDLRLDLLSYFNFVGAFNGFFLGIIFLGFSKKNKKSNYFLSALLMVLGILALGSFMSYTGFFRIYPQTQKLYSPFFFAIGPLLFLYTKAQYIDNFKFKIKMVWHFILVPINYIYYIPFYLLSNAEKIERLQEGLKTDIIIIRIVAFLQFIVYVYFIWSHILKLYQNAKIQFSSIEKLRIRWIGYLGIAYGSVILINIYPIFDSPILNNIVAVWEALLVIFVGYKGFFQPSINISELKKSDSESIVNQKLLDKRLVKIKQFMNEEKPYLDPEISLPSFSEKIGLSPYQFSNTLNKCLGKNFFTFINEYRINEVKDRLRNKKSQDSILKIAFDSGFNSKSTFNDFFKKMVGKTPSQYLKEIHP